jgi:hypothetical protein
MICAVQGHKLTDYFEKQVLRKRSYLTKELCVFVLENSVRSEPQEHARYRFWAAVPELGGRYLRVITLADRVTIHNAFLDRGFEP